MLIFNLKKIAIAILALTIAGLVLGITASLLYLQNRIYPGVSVAGISLGRQTREEALNLLYAKINKRLPSVLIVKHQNTKWHINLGSYNLRFRPERSIKLALKKRSLGLLLKNESINLPLEFTLDERALNKTIATISAQINYPAQNPQITLEKNSVKITPGQDGQKLNQEKTLALIKEALGKLEFKTLTLPVESLEVTVSKSQIEETRKRAQRLINKKLIITLEDNTDSLKNQRLLNLLSFKGGFDKVKIATLTASLAQSFNRKPQNAAFKIENGQVKLFKPARSGIAINSKIAKIQIEKALLKLESQKEEDLTIKLSYNKTPPEIKNEDVNNLGIRELLGRGESYFTGSAASRIYNLSLAASRVNGKLVSPGETFSFNATVGDISAATGYRSAYIIKDGRTILDDGGGVCQDSTTLFRAVLDAGLPVVERHQHSYRVVYYEKGGYKPGLDATVFAPNVDFKFKNDTPSYILIQSSVDRSRNKLTYKIYGTSDGRVTKITNHRVWDQQPPPEPLYQDDPTLPAGTVKQIDFASWGAKAAFDWKVIRNGETIIERTFYSNFSPWQAVYLRGTGGQ